MDRNEIYEKCFEIFIEHFNLEKEIKVLNEFEEKMYKKQLSNDNKNVSINHHLEFVPNNHNNTILDSSLSNENKTSKEFENEKNKLLDIIKLKLKNHEISLATASKPISDINVLYNFYDEDAKKYKIFQSNRR